MEFFTIAGMIVTGVFVLGFIRLVIALIQDFFECRKARNNIALKE